MAHLSRDLEEMKSQAQGDDTLKADVSALMKEIGMGEQSNPKKEKGKNRSDSRKANDKPKRETNKRDKKEPKPKKEINDKPKKDSNDKPKKESKTELKAVKSSEPKEKRHIKFDEPEKDGIFSGEVHQQLLEKPKHTKVSNLSAVTSEKLKILPQVDWYNIPVKEVSHPEKQDRFGIERLTERAKTLLENEGKIYLKEFASNSSQKKFLSELLQNGTLNDKISALTLMVQEAPIHNIKALETLLEHCRKKSRTAALQAVEGMKDLLLNGLLPDRKLLSLNRQNLSRDIDDVTLLIYYFEHRLKQLYFEFVQVLEALAQDLVLRVKLDAVTYIFELLSAKAEQEANLLKLGVNKLGDHEKKVLSKALWQLLELQLAHPAMTKVVTDAITDMAVRNADMHAQYYAVITLNQTVLSAKNSDVADSLVKTYFSLFEKVLVDNSTALKEKLQDKTLGQASTHRQDKRRGFKRGKHGGKSTKVEEKTEQEIVEEKTAGLFSALLAGLNRAFPYAQLPAETYLAHLDTLFKITHLSNFNTAVQALVFVHQIVTQQKLDTDRYFRTLYESLLDPRLVMASKQAMYLNLLYKSLKADDNGARRLAFVKRILQVCTHWLNVGVVTGMLYLLMELSKGFPKIRQAMREAAVDEYDPKKRNPAFANADKTCLWEMVQFQAHYHPTVSVYAELLIDGTKQPKPDVTLFTLSHFLDRFVYRNPKKDVLRGRSLMQPLMAARSEVLGNTSRSGVPLNTVDWLLKKAEDVRPEDRFFHQYFSLNADKIVRKDKDEKDESDEEVWEALVNESDDEVPFDAADFSDLSEPELSEEEPDFEGMDGIDMEDVGEAESGVESGEDEDFADFGEDDDEDDNEPKAKKRKTDLPLFADASDYAEYLLD